RWTGIGRRRREDADDSRRAVVGRIAQLSALREMTDVAAIGGADAVRLAAEGRRAAAVRRQRARRAFLLARPLGRGIEAAARGAGARSAAAACIGARTGSAERLTGSHRAGAGRVTVAGSVAGESRAARLAGGPAR